MSKNPISIKLGADTSDPKPQPSLPNVSPVPLQPKPLGKILGVDTSHYEPALDWKRAKADGVVWMYSKATEGLQHVDKSLKQHCDAAAAAGVQTGAYHFFHASMDGSAQAALFLRTTFGMKFQLPPCLDWEGSSADGQSSGKQQLEAMKWLDAVEKSTGKIPAIYGGESFLRELKLPPSFARYPLWLAHYGVPENRLRVPAPWKDYWAWQFTDALAVDGLAPGHHVDANWMRA